MADRRELKDLMPALVSVHSKLDSVRLCHGECITVFIGNGNEQVQVEIHRTSSGTMRVLLNEKNLGIVDTFERVYQ